MKNELPNIISAMFSVMYPENLSTFKSHFNKLSRHSQRCYDRGNQHLMSCTSSAGRQNGLTGYCFKYIDRSFCPQADDMLQAKLHVTMLHGGTCHYVPGKLHVTMLHGGTCHYVPGKPHVTMLLGGICPLKTFTYGIRLKLSMYAARAIGFTNYKVSIS